MTPSTTAAATPRAAVVPALESAWLLAKQSLRCAVFAQYDNARAMHGATADAAVRVVQSLVTK